MFLTSFEATFEKLRRKYELFTEKLEGNERLTFEIVSAAILSRNLRNFEEILKSSENDDFRKVLKTCVYKCKQ